MSIYCLCVRKKAKAVTLAIIETLSSVSHSHLFPFKLHQSVSLQRTLSLPLSLPLQLLTAATPAPPRTAC